MAPPLLQWREEHRIGIDALDFEHQDLFRRINELLDDFARHEERAEIEACLGEIHARMAASNSPAILGRRIRHVISATLNSG